MLTSVSSVAGDDHEGALEVLGAGVRAPLPRDRALGGQLLRAAGPASGEISVTSPSQASRPSTFSRPISPAADDQAPPPRELQARDVERRVEHVAHAGLVADPAAELADALLPGVGGGRHRPHRVVGRTLGHGRVLREPVHRRLDAAARDSRAGGRAVRPARAAHAGGAPGRLRGLLRAHGRARRALPAPGPDGSRARPRRLRTGRGRPPGDAPRARDAPSRARRAAPRPPGASRPARRTRRTIRRCCCGSSPRWSTRPPSSTSATSPR